MPCKPLQWWEKEYGMAEGSIIPRRYGKEAFYEAPAPIRGETIRMAGWIAAGAGRSRQEILRVFMDYGTEHYEIAKGMITGGRI